MSLFPLTACSSSAAQSRRGQAPTGDYLAQTSWGGELSFHGTKPGARLGFAFPPIFNRSHVDVTIDGVRVLSVPDGVHITGYGAFDWRKHGMITASHLGDGTATDYLHFADLFRPGTIEVAARERSRLLLDVQVTMQRRTSAPLTGCQIRYHTPDGRRWQQILDCDYVVHKNV